MQTGWINDGGTWYYTNSSGVMQTGWLEEGGYHYYLRGDGSMATGWREMDGAWYYFDGSGHMATGITEVNGLHYYLDPATGADGCKYRTGTERNQLSGGCLRRTQPGGFREPGRNADSRTVPGGRTDCFSQKRRVRPRAQGLPEARAYRAAPGFLRGRRTW